MQNIPAMYDGLKILQNYQNIAIVGISANPARPSYGVALYLQAAGYNLIPVNPGLAGKTLLGKQVYASLTEAKAAGETIEIVDVFRKPGSVPPIADEAIAIGAEVLWLQLGIVNAEARTKAQGAGLIFVEDKCIKIEHARFLGRSQ